MISLDIDDFDQCLFLAAILIDTYVTQISLYVLKERVHRPCIFMFIYIALTHLCDRFK